MRKEKLALKSISTDFIKNVEMWGQPRWLSGLAPPLAQGVILEARDQVPHQAPCMEAASPSARVSASLSVPLMNK